MRMLNFSIWTFSNPTWLLSRSSTGLLNYKTTYSCALPLTKLTLSDKLQDLLCCCSLLSPLTLRDHGRLQRHVNPNTGDLWDWRSTRMHTTEKIPCCILPWIITNLGKYFWCYLLKKNSLWCFLPCYSDLASSSLAVGDVAGDAPVLLEAWQWEGDEEPYLSPAPLACDWT